jgi:threonine/homoserine/homoserine lactone efflux protein
LPERAQILVFVAASAILGITPGPDIIYVITRGAAHGAPVQSAPITSPITSNVFSEDGPVTRFTRCKILPVLAALAGAMIAASGASAAESGAGFF